MAKRRKEKDEQEDKPFKLPKFDEEKFLKRERRNIKTTFLSFFLGILVALISFGFYALLSGNDLRWYLILLFGIFTGSWLKYLYLRLNIDLTDFTKKNWFSSYMIYFFSWLVVLMVIVNPPFYDDQEPLIELIVLPEIQEPRGNVMILAKITDNTGLEKENIEFTLDGNNTDNFEYIDSILRYTYIGPLNLTIDETHSFEIVVKDNSGYTTNIAGSFTFSNDAIYLAKPPSSPVIAADDIKFGVKSDVWRVYYQVDDGIEINATQQADRKEFYITTPEFQGWPRGEKNASVKVGAKLVYNFENHLIDGKAYWFENYINDTTRYIFDISNESSIGSIEVDDDDWVNIGMPGARIVSAPGFEILVFLISLGVVVLIFKYRKKDRRS
jgi:hypothetical protein